MSRRWAFDPAPRAGHDGAGGVPSGLIDIATIASIALGVTVGGQWMLAAMLAWGRSPVSPSVAAALTRAAKESYQPEREMPLFAAGCAASLTLAFGLNLAWRAGVRRRDPGRSGPYLRRVAVASSGIAILALLLFGCRLDGARGDLDVRGRPVRAAVALVGPGALALLAALAAYRSGPETGSAASSIPDGGPDEGPGGDDPPADADGPTPEPDRVRRGRPAREASIGAAMAVLLSAILLVPTPWRFAGRVGGVDFLPFHHWDFFAMAPAVAYLHGGSLGTEVYAQYGVGWPVLLAALDPVVPLGYGRAILIGMFYLCIYYFVIFRFLRTWTGSDGWAAAGVLLAVKESLFAGGEVTRFPGTDIGLSFWTFPIGTPLRTPMDAWFFLAMARLLRSGRPAWAAAMGACAGLAVVFVTESGLFLVAAFLVHLAFLVSSPAGPRAGRARLAAVAALALASATAALIGGLAVASRGTILRPEFWRGWLEPLRAHGAGVSSLPMATVASPWTLVLFLAITGGYLTTLGFLGSRRLEGRADGGVLIGGCLATYGVCRMLYFVNRSAPGNLQSLVAPLCLILAWGAATAWRRLDGLRAWPRAGARAPWVAAGLVLAAMAAAPNFRAYPNFLNRVVSGPLPEGLRLMPDVHGLPLGDRSFVAEFRAISRELAALRAGGSTVALLDPADTLYYLGSGCPPRDRYSPLLLCLSTKEEVRAAKARFLAQKIDWVFERFAYQGWSRSNLRIEDIRAEFLDGLRSHYVPHHAVGSFVVWARRPGGAGPSRPEAD